MTFFVDTGLTASCLRSREISFAARRDSPSGNRILPARSKMFEYVLDGKIFFPAKFARGKYFAREVTRAKCFPHPRTFFFRAGALVVARVSREQDSCVVT
ncbi:MAG TPA: hypothetical protein VG734_14485 [Lacunisphaera sp.]|nr:hypothetical protein [Lacunisphaera sp.]